MKVRRGGQPNRRRAQTLLGLGFGLVAATAGLTYLACRWDGGAVGAWWSSARPTIELPVASLARATQGIGDQTQGALAQPLGPGTGAEVDAPADDGLAGGSDTPGDGGTGRGPADSFSSLLTLLVPCAAIVAVVYLEPIRKLRPSGR